MNANIALPHLPKASFASVGFLFLIVGADLVFAPMFSDSVLSNAIFALCCTDTYLLSVQTLH